MKSDKVLLTVATIAFVLSLVSAVASLGGVSFAGHATSSGDAKLTVSQNLEINFTDKSIDWGSGRVDTGDNAAVLYSNGTIINSTGGNAWTSVNNPLVLENLGNTNASINLSAGSDADAFIGGGSASDAPSPEYKWKVSENEGDSCGTTFAPTSFSSVNTTGEIVCDPFKYVDSRDELGIDIKVKVPYDAPVESKSDTITATATAV